MRYTPAQHPHTGSPRRHRPRTPRWPDKVTARTVRRRAAVPGRQGGHLAPTSLQAFWHPARAKAGRTDLRFHDLRHTGATLAAATGATLADLMARLGHSTPSEALRYQHSVADRDRAIAEALSGFADASVVALRRAN